MDQGNQKTKAMQEKLTRIYGVLKFTPEEVVGALNDLAGIQQIEAATELMKVLGKDEIRALDELAQKSDEEKRAIVEKITKIHAADNDFMARAQAAADSALNRHIEYLKTRGDESQKQQIAEILAQAG